MSITPFLFNGFWTDPSTLRSSRLLDQHFGLDLDIDDLLSPLTIRPYSRRGENYYRPWRSAVAHRDTGSTVSADKDKFQVCLDVQQFSPEEITVKTVDDSVVIEGKHEEKQDEHGYISRHFVRRYMLPQGHDVQAVQSKLSSDGVLTITAPKTSTKESDEKIIPIEHTGPARAVESKEKKPAEKPITHTGPASGDKK